VNLIVGDMNKIQEKRREILGRVIDLFWTTPLECVKASEAFVVESGFRPKTMNREHDHAIAAASREIAERKAVIYAIKDCINSSVDCHLLDYFGGKRLLFFCKKIRQILLPKYREMDEFFTYSWYRPLITAKDVCEYSSLLEQYPSVVPCSNHILLIVDVYHATPSMLSMLPCSRIWSVMQFYGVDTVAGVNFNTAPFFIHDSGFLYQRPGPKTEPWVPHKEYLSSRIFESCSSDEGISWIRKENVQEYYILKIANHFGYVGRAHFMTCRNGIVKIPAQNVAKQWINRVTHNLWGTSFFSGFNKDMYVDMDIVREFIGKRTYTARQSFALTSVAHTVAEMMNEEKYKVLFSFWPMDKERVIQDTSDYILWKNITDEHTSLYDNVVNYGWRANEIKSMKNTMTTNGCFQLFSLKRLVLMILTFGCVVGVKRLANFLFPQTRLRKDSILRFYKEIMKIPLLAFLGAFGATRLVILYKFLLYRRKNDVSRDRYQTTLLGGPENSDECVRIKQEDLGLQTITSPQSWDNFKDAYRDLTHMSIDISTIEVPIHDNFLPARNLDVKNDEDIKTGIYIMTATKALMVRPHGTEMFRLAYRLRNLAPMDGLLGDCEKLCKRGEHPNNTDKCVLFEHWSMIRSILSKQHSWFSKTPRVDKGMFDEVLNSEKWIQHFPTAAKKARAANAMERKREGIYSTRVECFLKSDEVLFPKMIEGVMNIKPRVIQNVNPDLQAMCATAIDTFITYLKEFVFNPTIDYYVHDTFRVTFTIGSGLDHNGLDKWFNFCWVDARDSPINVLHSIVAGDDYFGILKENGVVSVIENDFSSYDRTEGVHALLTQYSFMKSFGFPPRLIDLIKQSTWSTPFFC